MLSLCQFQAALDAIVRAEQDVNSPEMQVKGWVDEATDCSHKVIPWSHRAQSTLGAALDS